MSSLSLRCPSCEHGNPAGAKFCNNCGLPVHLQPCGNCEAINEPTANRCYKCGGPLSLMPVLQPSSARAAADTIVTPSSTDRTIVDHPTPASSPVSAAADTTVSTASADRTGADHRTPVLEESPPHAYDATIDAGDTDISGGAVHTSAVDETLTAPSRQPEHQDFVSPGARSDTGPIEAVAAKRRRPGLRVAVAVVMLVALAVPAYLAYQDPAPFREHFDAFTTRFNTSSDEQSSQTVPADSPVSQQSGIAPPLTLPQGPATSSGAPPAGATGESPAGPADASRDSQSPPLDAAGAPQSSPADAAGAPQPTTDAAHATQSPATNSASEPQPLPSKAGSEPKLSSPETRATPRPQAAKNVRQSPVRSAASGSKQGNVSRTPVSAKGSDARTRAKGADARRSEPKEKAASRRVATRPGRSPAAAQPSPSEGTSSTLSTESSR